MVPQTKVFVGSLPQGSTTDDIRKLFENYGVVTECDILNRCAFVHMETEDQASAAIEALHNTNFNGGVISVERGRIKERVPRSGLGSSNSFPRGPSRNVSGFRRGGNMGVRNTPYMRNRSMLGPMRAGNHENAIERHTGSGHYAEDRFSAYGNYGEDQRGFSLMPSRNDQYSPHMYSETRGYNALHLEHVNSMYDDNHRPAYDQNMSDRRGPMSSGYDRGSQSAHINNGDFYSRRSPMHGTPANGYNRDPYTQQYDNYGPVPYYGGPRGGGGRGRGMRR